MKIYHTETQEDYDALMVELESKGILWFDGEKPTGDDCWRYRKEETVILLRDDKVITYGGLTSTKNNFLDVPIQKYKVKKGDKVEEYNSEHETIEIIRDILGSEGFQDFCVGNIIKHVSKYKDKNSLEDIQEVGKYIEFLRE